MAVKTVACVSGHVNYVAGRRHLHSVSPQQLFMPCYHLSIFGCPIWAVSVAGPVAWNLLPGTCARY